MSEQCPRCKGTGYDAETAGEGHEPLKCFFCKGSGKKPVRANTVEGENESLRGEIRNLHQEIQYLQLHCDKILRSLENTIATSCSEFPTINTVDEAMCAVDEGFMSIKGARLMKDEIERLRNAPKGIVEKASILRNIARKALPATQKGE